MTQTAETGVDELRRSIGGLVFAPDDAGYDDARRVWNADIDWRSAVIAKGRTAEEVRAPIVFATSTGLEIAVRAVHTQPDRRVECRRRVDDRPSPMNQAMVDPEAKRARVGSGGGARGSRRGHAGARARSTGGNDKPHRRRGPAPGRRVWAG